LNADLFRVHLANDPGCICGCSFEDAIHYILECCLYNEAREEQHDLIVEGKKECANNCNLVNGFLNSVWLRKFNSFSSRIKGSKQSYK
jgi:hypothetical protein